MVILKSTVPKNQSLVPKKRLEGNQTTTLKINQATIIRVAEARDLGFSEPDKTSWDMIKEAIMRDFENTSGKFNSIMKRR